MDLEQRDNVMNYIFNEEYPMSHLDMENWLSSKHQLTVTLYQYYNFLFNNVTVACNMFQLH